MKSWKQILSKIFAIEDKQTRHLSSESTLHGLEKQSFQLGSRATLIRKQKCALTNEIRHKKLILDSTFRLYQLRFDGTQHISHGLKCAAATTTHAQHCSEQQTNSTANSKQHHGNFSCERQEVEMETYACARTRRKSEQSRRKEAHGPPRRSSALHPAVSFPLLLLSSLRLLLDKFADVNKHSVSTGKALWSQPE